MAMYKPSELRSFLSGLGIFPKKGLSQNFLIDGNIIRKIVMASKVEKDDLVLEIGPGPGALTQALLDTGARVIAVEKDQVLAKELERLNTPDNRLEIFCQDIMEFPIQDILKSRLKEHQKAKVVANLPYHLTTPILEILINLDKQFSTLTVMVQEEVARRFTAHPGTSNYSSFTIFLNFYSSPHYAFKVSHHCFYPAPTVESAVVVLELHPPALTENVDSFFVMTRTAFEHRRKMLRGSLKLLYGSDRVEQALTHIGLTHEARPEMLSLEQFLSLYHLLESTSISK